MRDDSKRVGIIIAVLFHIALLMILITQGWKKISPLPQELGIEVDYTAIEEAQPITASAPEVGNVDKFMGNRSEQEKIQEPKQQKKIDTRSLFPGERSESTSEQTTQEDSDSQRDRSALGESNEKTTARLKGRTLIGTLPLPDYSINLSGKVVVRIVVDQYGNVVSATPGIAGTTVQNRVLWSASKEAALKTKFNLSSEAETFQEGTITYIFRLE